MDKQFGKGTVLRLGANNVVPVSTISSGCLSLDAALGVGGFPRGRVAEVFGPESSGKTTLALQVIAQAQKTGGAAAFIDAEHALDPIYAKKLGVDVDNLLVSQPDTGEQALEITAALVQSGVIDVIVLDSVAALVPKAELEGEMGDSHMGLHARLMSQALRKLTGIISRTNTCMIFINQVREKIGVMFGNPETTTGGRALKFYSSIRAEVRRTAPIKDGDAVIGNRTKVKIVKNKVASPFREAEFDLLYGEGASREGDLLDLGVTRNLVEKSGSWYSYRGERIGQGRENARVFLKEHPQTADKLDEDLRVALGLTPKPKNLAVA
jgi:recombination protein RecA